LCGECIKRHNGFDEFVIITYKNLPLSVGHANKDEIKSTVKRARRIREPLN